MPMDSMLFFIAAVQKQSASCVMFDIVAHKELKTPDWKRR